MKHFRTYSSWRIRVLSVACYKDVETKINVKYQQIQLLWVRGFINELIMNRNDIEWYWILKFYNLVFNGEEGNQKNWTR